MDPDPDPRKEIEVDPDPDPERGLKWIRIRPNAVDPGGSGSGSETLIEIMRRRINYCFGHLYCGIKLVTQTLPRKTKLLAQLIPVITVLDLPG